MRRENFADQHPRDGTETEGEQHYEHAHGREWNESNGRNVVIVALHVEKGADQQRADAHHDNGPQEQNFPSQPVDDQRRDVRGDYGHDADDDRGRFRFHRATGVLYVRGQTSGHVLINTQIINTSEGNQTLYFKNVCGVEYDGVASTELLQKHHSEADEQTAFSGCRLERFHDWNSFTFGLRKNKTLYCFELFFFPTIDISFSSHPHKLHLLHSVY